MEASHTDIPKDLKIDGQSFSPQLRGEKGNPRGMGALLVPQRK